jgi:uroporphyrinogen-III synthase
MRVLVTRPLRQGERTAKRLRAMGHEPMLLSLSEPVHDSSTAIGALNRSTVPIAITSAEAICALAASPLALQPHLERVLYAVGDASADEARAAGFKTVLAASGDGSKLAEMIADDQRHHVLYLAGSPRAKTFEDKARELDIAVEVVESYGMRAVTPGPQALDVLATSPPEAVLFYSTQTALRFFQLFENMPLPDWLANAAIICLSDAVAAAVPQPLHANRRIAAMADERGLLSLL